MTSYRESKSCGYILLSFIGLVIVALGAVVMGAGYLLIKLGAMPLPMKPLSDFDWIDRKDGSIWKGSKSRTAGESTKVLDKAAR